MAAMTTKFNYECVSTIIQINGTRVETLKLSQTCTRVCWQVRFVLLVLNWNKHFWSKMLRTCKKNLTVVSACLQACFNKTDHNKFLQPCVVNFVTNLLQQVCIKVVRTTL